MACGDDLKTLLSRHVDGELSPEERSHVDEHLAACASCRELLQLFQKNESILSNALSTESFGNTVIESVISEIKREAQPVEAKPVEEGTTDWFRSRPAIPLAAAALFVVGLVVVLSSAHNRDLNKMREQITDLSRKVNTGIEATSRMSDEQEKVILGLRTDDA
ncbi:MAG: zf-HC2 domain-containing protein, partial [Planctomycetes bacterium]|nr:zf-HC2 domain-containing protein [Planctomycetota bacterium]